MWPAPSPAQQGGSLQPQGSFLNLWALPLTSGFPGLGISNSSGWVLSLPSFGAPSQFPGLSMVLCLGLALRSCPCSSELTRDTPACCAPASL